MFEPRILQLIADLRGETIISWGFQWDNPEGKYNHSRLADFIHFEYPTNTTLQSDYKGIPAKMMSAGSYLGLNVIQIRELFLPHTVKAGFESITAEMCAKVLENALTSDRIEWYLVTETHMKMGSLGQTHQAHDPKYLKELSDDQ